MLVRTVTIPAEWRDRYFIYLLADAHIGDADCAEEELAAWLDGVRQNHHGRIVILGDLISAIGKGDRRLDLKAVAPWVIARQPRFHEDVLAIEAERAVALLRPVQDRIDAWISGNHEQKPRAWYGRDITREMVRDLGLDPGVYLGSLGWLSYSFARSATARRSLDIVLHHGTASGRHDGGQAGQLEELLMDYDCDVAVVGHSHNTLGISKPQIRRDRKGARLVQRDRRGIVAGTWQRTPGTSDTWQDERRLRPRRVGGVVIEYTVETGAIEVVA